MKFHHKECIASLAVSAFKLKYKSWCSKNGYRYSESKAAEIHAYSRNVIAVLLWDESAELLVEQSCKQLNAMLETISAMRKELNRLAQQLPEYETVIGMFGVGKILAPQLMAEIGDTRRFKNRRAITAFAGLDAPPYQSGTIDVKSRNISKRGSSQLRKTLFQVVKCYLIRQPQEEPVYRFLDKKRSEGKKYLVYMMAAANKFLRIYFARVNQVLEAAQ